MRIANRYDLEYELGAGGMGTVYRGLDTQSRQAVAIKRLKPEISHVDLIERFKREGEALRDLNHPNIVKMLDSVEHEGVHYLVMEHVAGGDLADLLRRGKLPIERCLKLALDLADALTRAHKLDIIHRDLKPANVLLAADGTLRLTDFGVAYHGQRQRVTDTGIIVGTVDYMSPETLNGENIDARADIWSFGVMLFEMLAGQRPFTGESVTHTMFGIITQPVPDIEELRPDAPISLIDLIYRMLDKNRHGRVASVRIVGAELEAILQGRTIQIAIPSRFDTPIPDTFNRPKHNLPAQPTPFVGREAELDEVAKLLDDPKIRLVTILAPGGMGKTRLSLESAEQLLTPPQPEASGRGFNDGVYFVELAPLSDLETIIPAIAEATSFQFQSDERSQKQQVLDFLREKKLLLVMDNYEHLLDGAALVTDILKAAPQVKVLATSRQRLNQAGETLLHLSGMDFPQWETPADAIEYAAVKLFMNSAGRARPDFELTQENLNYVARICRLVQGMPLGIVLAAAWLAMLSPEEIAAELQQSVDILQDEAGAVPERQQSIRVVFDYSWQTMTGTEQQIFMKMSVFRGGFSRNAAQSITGATLQQLMSLVNKSLLRRDNNNGRYEIHELLRQYAAEKLAQSGGEASTRTAHTSYYANALKEREAHLKDSRAIQALDDIEMDFENVRAAWFWAIEQQNEQALDAMLSSLTEFAEYRNRATECLELLEATATLEAVISRPVWGRLLAHRGCLCANLFQFKAAEPYLAKALTIAREHQQQADVAFALWKLALVIDEQGEKEQALKQAEESLALYQALADAYHEADLHHYLGYLHAARFDDLVQGTELTRKSYAIRKTFGQPIKVAACFHNLGVWELFLGDMNNAEAYLSDSLRLRQQAKDVGGIGFSMSLLLWVNIYDGRFEQAEVYTAEMVELGKDSGNPIFIYLSQWNRALLRLTQERYEEALKISAEAGGIIESYTQDSRQYHWHEISYGFALCGLGNYAEASKWVNRALLHAVDTAQPAHLNFILMAKSLLFVAHGDYERALEILAVVRTDPSTRMWRDSIPLATNLMEQLKAHFGKELYNTIYERGTQLNWRETVKQLASELAEDNG
jgi:serine/threonine protein kinase/tetratricopeptide (TPR) repeat protein